MVYPRGHGMVYGIARRGMGLHIVWLGMVYGMAWGASHGISHWHGMVCRE